MASKIEMYAVGDKVGLPGYGGPLGTAKAAINQPIGVILSFDTLDELLANLAPGANDDTVFVQKITVELLTLDGNPTEE